MVALRSRRSALLVPALAAVVVGVAFTTAGSSDSTAQRVLDRMAAQHAGPQAAVIRRGLADAVAAGRLSRLSAARRRATLTRTAAAIDRLPIERAAILSSVLQDVADQAPIYDEPRSLALFGMLDANRTHLATRDVIGERQDIVDADGVVYRFYPGHGFQFQPLANFAHLNGHVSGSRAAVARRLAHALVARGIRRRGALYWEYYFPFDGPSRWNSGLAQAAAAQALTRAANLLDDWLLARAALSAFRAIPQSLLRPLAGGAWIREYGFSDVAILNAQLQSLVWLDKVAALTDRRDVRRTAARLAVATRALLPQFDTGCWSRYSLGGPNADLHYHTYHVQLLQRLAATRPGAIWKTTADRWSRYLENETVPCAQP